MSSTLFIFFFLNTGSSVLLKTENGEFLEDGHEEMKVSDQQHNAGSGRSLEPLKNSHFVCCIR